VRLLEQRVDQCGLAVVNMRDDGDVAQIAAARRRQFFYGDGWTILGNPLPGLA
jgi:hypothetical protein